jgi:hypothetical protein
MGGGHDSDEGKVVGEGVSGGGGDRPQTANSISTSSLGTNSLVITERTHKIRAIQQINRRVANIMMKIVGASATKTMGVLVMNILVEIAEWGFFDEMNK